MDWGIGGLRVTAAGTAVDWEPLTADGLETYISPYVDSVPAELETDRVQRFCDDAGVSITIEGVPARRVRAIPAGTLAQPLLDMILRVADDCDALLLEDRLGVLHYRTRNFDRPAPYTLPSTVVERDTIDMAYERGTHYNAVRVFFGEPDATTGQQDWVYDNDTSTYGTIFDGERITDIYTDIQYRAGAEGKSGVFLERNRLEWVVPDVTLVMSLATPAEADDILDLQQNWMVTLDDLPTGCSIASYDGDILGMTDIMHETDYRIVLHLGPRMADTGGVPESPIFPEDSCTGGTESTYEDGNGFLWQVHVFDTPGTYTLTCNEPVTGDLLLIGGGGGGGQASLTKDAGGGGAGAVWNREVTLTPGVQNITIGAGGAAAGSGSGADGETSKFNDLWVYGGGGGGRYEVAGSPGGYGGGGGGQLTGGGTGTYGSLDAGATTNTSAILGGDGGAATTSRGGHGGGASLVSSITGTEVTYAIGGRGGDYGATIPEWTTPGSGGRGGSVLDGGKTAGENGIAVYRYRIG